MTGLGALHDFHTEYVIDGERYDRIDPHSQGVCFRTLKLLRDKAQEAGDQQLVKDINKDIKHDPALEGISACLYRSKYVDNPLLWKRLTSHERFHAYVNERQRTVWSRQSFVAPNGNTFRLLQDARIAVGLNRIGPDVGQAFALMAKVAGWVTSDYGASEEALARIAELEACYALRAGDFIERGIASLERLEKETRSKYPRLFKIEEGDFMKVYHRIQAHWGSVKGFINSLDDVMPTGMTRLDGLV